MSKITPNKTIKCGKCHQMKNTYCYESGYKDTICVECLVQINKNEFPQGKSIYRPCELCLEPKIKWYCDGLMPLYDCGNHGVKYSDYAFWDI